MLAASAAALPTLLATASCRSSDLFAGPDPLAGRPALSPDVITLQAVIAAEHEMITLYQAAMAAVAASPSAAVAASPRAAVLADLLAQHRQHLSQLQARLVVPSGAPSPSAGVPRVTGPGRVTVARLRAAERASAADLVRRLVTVPPALAQLFASIAASDATHVTALS